MGEVQQFRTNEFEWAGLHGGGGGGGHGDLRFSHLLEAGLKDSPDQKIDTNTKVAHKRKKGVVPLLTCSLQSISTVVSCTSWAFSWWMETLHRR